MVQARGIIRNVINEKYARQYCSEDFSKIENYELAVLDVIETWDIHHRAEILPCGRFSRKDLKKFGLYYARPASELIFLTPTEHIKLHRIGQRLSEDTRRKLRQVNLGKLRSDETRRKMSEAQRKRRLVKKTEGETQRKRPIKQYSGDGTFVARYPSTHEAMRRTGTPCSSIVECCRGRRRSAGGYIWKYA